MLWFVSLAVSSNEKQVYCMTIWGIDCSANWVWNLSTLTAFLLQYGSSFLLLS